MSPIPAARNHVNRMCLAADVPLVESGTAGYLGQATVIKKVLHKLSFINFIILYSQIQHFIAAACLSNRTNSSVYEPVIG